MITLDITILSLGSKITPAYTHITELFQQVFMYNEEAHCSSHTICAQVLELPQSHFGDNQAMITLYSSCFCEIWALCVV